MPNSTSPTISSGWKPSAAFRAKGVAAATKARATVAMKKIARRSPMRSGEVAGAATAMGARPSKWVSHGLASKVWRGMAMGARPAASRTGQ